VTDTTDRPRRRDDVVYRDLGEEAMLYDPRADRVVRLNATSRRIWELCDGAHDAAAITSTLAHEFDAPAPEDLAADVAQALASFAAAGLLAGSRA
jgi:PqqD family protein of HPr-rel-A system